MAERERLRLAMVIPPFSRGSGGHNTLFQIFSRLERRGHMLQRVAGRLTGNARCATWPAVLRHDIREFFAPFEGPVYKGFERLAGRRRGDRDRLADGARGARCSTSAGRAPTSSTTTSPSSTRPPPSTCSPRTPTATACTASPRARGCATCLIERYGASADAFQLGVEHDTYRPRPSRAATDTVDLLRAPRHPAARGADRADGARASCTAAGPDVRIVLFGDRRAARRARSPTSTSACSPHRSSSRLYSEATVGLCLSLTNFSLMPKEMLACGLPCVELAGVSAESIFGADGPLELAALDPRAIADALERLLDDPELRERRSREGIEFVASPHLGSRHRRGRSGAAPRAARARTRRRAQVKKLPSVEQLRGVAEADHRDHEHRRKRHVPAAAQTEGPADRDRRERRDRGEDVAALFGDHRAPTVGREEGRLHRHQHAEREQRDDGQLEEPCPRGEPLAHARSRARAAPTRPIAKTITA